MLELELMEILGAIKEKPGWERKVCDEGIMSKWRDELTELGRRQGRHAYRNDYVERIDYAVQELRWQASNQVPLNCIRH